MRVLVPSAHPANAAQSLRLKLDSLQGKVIGVIDNSKPNFDNLADDVCALLMSKYGVARVVRKRKTAAGIPAPQDMVKELTAECDAVITGLGD